jgi:Zn-dependent protease with chaperone function
MRLRILWLNSGIWISVFNRVDAAQTFFQLNGNFFDGKSSHGLPAQLKFDGAEFTLACEGGARKFKRGDVQLLEASGGPYRSFRILADGLFETPDLGEVQNLQALLGGETLYEKLVRSWRFTTVAAAIVVAVCAFYYWVALPQLARFLAFRTPQSVLTAISSQAKDIMAKVDGISPAKLTEAEQARADTVFARMRELFGDQLSFHLIRSGSYGANAFVLPDGTAYVTDDLVRALSEDEILAVLLHELGHVRERHQVQMIVQGTGLIVFSSVVFGQNSWSTAPVAALSLVYSRQHESEADAFAAHQLMQLGLKPTLLADALSKIEKVKGDFKYPSFLSTHPSSDERIQTLQRQR